jgi:hypothetical protein
VKLQSSFKNRCEGFSATWRHRLGLEVIDSLPAETLLRALDLNVEVRTPEQIPTLSPHQIEHLAQADDWSAGIIRLAPLFILLHPAHTGARRESDLMHEAAHVLLKHPMIGFSPKTGLPLRDPRYEEEATYLGACLQIPRLGLAWFVKKNATCQQIATHFGASEAMVRFRSNLTGIPLLPETSDCTCTMS